MIRFSGQAQKLTGAIAMLLVIYRSTPKSWSRKKKLEAETMELMPMTKPDASNYLKGVEDALNGILFDDDAQIVLPMPFKAYSSKPRIELFIAQDLKWAQVLQDLIAICAGDKKTDDGRISSDG
jgi:Holliday junction resolvase RusA-like endonuclease